MTKDPRGLAKWAKSPHPWTALRDFLVKHGLEPAFAARTASEWFKEVFGYAPSSRGGRNPVGPS